MMSEAHSSSEGRRSPVSKGLTIVIPAYNEERRILPTLEKIRTYATQCGEPIELIVVDDGSRDRTVELVRAFDPGPMQFRVLVNEKNSGKGFSVRRGMLEGRMPVVLMSDADLSTPIEEYAKLRLWLEKGFGVVIGSRNMADSILEPPQPLKRRVMGAVFRGIRRALLLASVKDSQCGFKAFERSAAQEVFALQTETGFAFDCEVLALAVRLGYKVREVGVLWQDNRDSRVNAVRDSWRMLVAAFRIRKRLRSVERRSAPRTVSA